MEIINQILQLGKASYLTKGAERGWFEYGRPGHPKDFRPPYVVNDEIDNNILNQKEDE